MLETSSHNHLLWHKTEHSTTEQPGSRGCQRSRCNTCEYIKSLIKIRGPKSTFTIRDHFTCMSETFVYCVSCRRCSHVYIGETGQSFRSRFGEHLRNIRNSTPGFPVAQRFNSVVSQYHKCPGAGFVSGPLLGACNYPIFLSRRFHRPIYF